jgi:hypothetical protein
MRDGRIPVLLAAACVCLGGGCKRAVLGDPDAGGAGMVRLDAGSPAVDVGGQSAADASGSDLGVDRSADGTALDGIVFIPVPGRGGCENAPPAGICPIDRPETGSACASTGAICEYGGADLWCRDGLRCAEDLTWQPAPPGCGAEVAGRCPSTTPDSGSACDREVWCGYPDQTICVCNSSEPMRWWCGSARIDPECPGQLPLHGSRCDRDGQHCYYGGCFYVGICCGGSWVSAPAPCSE